MAPESSRAAGFTGEQRLLLLDAWIRSKLAATEFAELVGVTSTTLYAWRWRFEDQGPAGLLETARALRAAPPLRNDVYLFFTDGEEPAPRHGSKATARSRPLIDTLGLVLNFEATGGSGASLLVETSGPQRWLIEELAAADAQPAAFSFLTQTSRLMGDIGTDFDSFRNADIPGFHFVYLHGSSIYHTPADDVAAVSLASLQHHGRHALDVARHFGSLDLAAARPADRMVFFTVGSRCIRYPASWSLPLAVLAVVVLLLATWRRRTLARGSSPRPARRALRTVSGGLAATLVGTLAWVSLSSLRSTPGVAEGYVYLACTLLLATWIAHRIAHSPGAEPGHEIPWLWALAAVLSAIWLPGYSYLFVWPLLAAAIVLAWTPTTRGVLGFLIVAVPTLVLMTPPVAIFFQLASPRPGNPGSEMPAAVALPVLLTLLAAGLLRTTRPARLLRGG